MYNNMYNNNDINVQMYMYITSYLHLYCVTCLSQKKLNVLQSTMYYVYYYPGISGFSPVALLKALKALIEQ